VIVRAAWLQKAIPAVILAGMAFFVFGCAQKPSQPKMESRIIEKDLFSEAEAYRLNGQADKASKIYGEYLLLNPKGDKAALSLQRMAEMALARGDEAGALSFYRQIPIAGPYYRGVPEVRYQISRLLAVMGDPSSSNTEAEAWLNLYPDHPRRGEVFLLRADNAGAVSDRKTSFRYWLKAQHELGDSSPVGASVGKRIETIIEAAGTEDLRWMASEAESTPYAPIALKRLARLLMELEELEEAEIIVSRLATLEGDPQQRQDALELVTELKDRKETRKGVIGCLLPLSGPFANFGKEVLMGIQLAIMTQENGQCRSPVEIIVKDSGGDEESVKAAVMDLVDKKKVMAIIGPLSRRVALLAAETAQGVGVPIVTLTQREEITSSGDMVFRFFPTPAIEVDSVLEMAVDRLGIERFAVMYPENAYGRLLAALFFDAVTARGGSVTAAESYGEDETDFEEEIKKLTGRYYPNTRQDMEGLRQLITPEEEETVIIKDHPRSIIDFEALFIPDRAERVAMIAPQLIYHDAVPSALFGTSLWQSPDLVKSAGEYLNNAFIPSSFFEELDSEMVRGFGEAFRNAYESSPRLLSAQGYDSLRLLAQAMCRDDVRTRKHLAKALLEISDAETLRGKATCTASREIRQKAPLLTISNGRIVKVLP